MDIIDIVGIFIYLIAIKNPALGIIVGVIKAGRSKQVFWFDQ
jgi:hypothetical protein